MQATQLPSGFDAPIVIGGVGGSGTRLIARSLLELGYAMGHNLNQAYDNLWFTLLFKRLEVLDCSDEKFDTLAKLFVTATTRPGLLARQLMKLLNDLALVDRPNLLRSLLRKLAKPLLARDCRRQHVSRWGWKEPNSHVVLDRLSARFPKMKYIHVVRNGLDMAYSRNQKQLKLWGPHFIGEACDVSPRSSLKYWCAVQRRVLASAVPMGERFLLLNYDEFCLRPRDGVCRLRDFLDLRLAREQRESLLRLVSPPDSIGRFKRHGTHVFDEQDVAYVSELGFDIGEQASTRWPSK